jgi:hypothetical protein
MTKFHTDKVMLEINGWTKFAEEDVIGEGHVLGSGRMRDGKLSLSAKTELELIDRIVSFLCADTCDIELNACGEPGRVDVSFFEDANGTPATKGQIALWKQGKQRLWHCTYTFQAERVTRSDFNFEITVESTPDLIAAYRAGMSNVNGELP